MIAASEKMRDGNENYGSQRSRRQRVQKSSAKNPQPDENPTADVGTYQAKQNVTNAAEAAAACNLSRKPSCNQAKKKPRYKAVGFEPDSYRLLREHICGQHETSWWKPDCS
jgi:hypothetical protein